MTVRDILVKAKLRLNKAASEDYDNIWKYHAEEAFYKATLDLVRRLIRGKNQTQEGDEESTSRIDDLQVLLKSDVLLVKNKGLFAETNKLPKDYLYFKRVTPIVSKGSCSEINIASDLREEANVDKLLAMCSFDFEETFHTIIDNRIRVYHNNDFTVNRIEFVYYRLPKKVSFKNLDTIIEFKDDVCEMIVDEMVKIISSDIESLNQKQLAQERVETNN
jgi:hypothetical protein